MPLPARKFKAFVENATDMALFARMILDILSTVKDKLEEKGIIKEKGGRLAIPVSQQMLWDFFQKIFNGDLMRVGLAFAEILLEAAEVTKGAIVTDLEFVRNEAYFRRKEPYVDEIWSEHFVLVFNRNGEADDAFLDLLILKSEVRKACHRFRVNRWGWTDNMSGSGSSAGYAEDPSSDRGSSAGTMHVDHGQTTSMTEGVEILNGTSSRVISYTIP